jgi:hypothetical protein
MGLVQNLKKILKNMVEIILVELSYLYIKQKAKQTMKRPVNSSSIMSSQNHLTKEDQHTIIPTLCPDISEKTTMETQIEPIEPVVQVRDWAIEKIEMLHESDRHRNAAALLAEFDEWINLPDDQDEISYLCIEDEEWTDEQEVDVR